MKIKKRSNLRRGDTTVLTTRFVSAVAYAARIHKRQVKRGTRVPYAAHLLGVASLVLGHGGDEEQTIAALLHDAVEDQGGLPRLAEIRQKFGRRVARIVKGCTDAYAHPKPPWCARKMNYLQHLPHSPRDVQLVSAADKLYNAREILADYRALGEKVFSRFHGGKEGTLWYYRSLAGIFRRVGPKRLGRELSRVVDELERLVPKSG